MRMKPETSSTSHSRKSGRSSNNGARPMLQRKVYCGGLKPVADDGDTLILDLKGASGSTGNITLQIHELSRRLARSIPDLLVDLLEVATYAYCADQLTRRETPFMSSMGSDWRRRF